MNLPFGGEDIVQPVEVPNIPDPTPGTVEHEAALARDASTRSIAAMPWLPQGPDEWAHELHDRIVEAERTYVSPRLKTSEYRDGTATEPDDIEVIRGSVENPYLFTAEHATSPGKRKAGGKTYPDTGTGGLAAVLGEDYGTALIMRGRQTSNVPLDPEHPIKPKIREELVIANGFLAVHGKNPGMFVHPTDRAEIHACIGLGMDPTEALLDFAHSVARAARDDLGLYVVVSNEQPAYIQKPHSTELKRVEDNSVKISQLAALNPLSSTNFARDTLQAMGRNIPAMQMELTSLLRATPLDTNGKDRKARIIGIALGYKLLEEVVQLTYSELQKPELGTLTR